MPNEFLPDKCPCCQQDAYNHGLMFNNYYKCGASLERDDVSQEPKFKFACPNTDVWIEWKGGEKCPVEDGVIGEAKMRDGKMLKYAVLSLLRWTHRDSISDIISYRRLPPAKEPPADADWHNPARLDGPGKGYRFFVPQELDGRHNGRCEMWTDGKWCDSGKYNGRCETCTYRVPISTPFPPSPAKESADEWRDLLPGELVMEGDEFYVADKDYWLRSVVHITDNGKQARHTRYRTRRPAPLPPTETAGWFPDKGDWYESRVIGEKKWHEPVQAMNIRAAYEIENRTSVIKHEYRPASPPKTVNTLADTLVDIMLKAELKQEQEPEQTHTTMNTQTPQVGQRWSTAEINSGGEAVRPKIGKVLAINEDVILLEFGKRKNTEEVAYTTKEWAKRANVQLDVKPEKVKKERNPNATPFFRRIVRKAIWNTTVLLTGALLSGPIGVALKSAIAFLAGLLAAWLK